MVVRVWASAGGRTWQACSLLGSGRASFWEAPEGVGLGQQVVHPEPPLRGCMSRCLSGVSTLLNRLLAALCCHVLGSRRPPGQPSTPSPQCRPLSWV